MNTPDFEAIASMLASAEPIDMKITPVRAFTLVALLQFCLRNPDLEGVSNAAEVAHSMATNLIAKLGEIDPAIAVALNQGWDTSLDCTRLEFELMVQAPVIAVVFEDGERN